MHKGVQGRWCVVARGDFFRLGYGVFVTIVLTVSLLAAWEPRTVAGAAVAMGIGVALGTTTAVLGIRARHHSPRITPRITPRG
ncbi:hypothetical protein ABIA38_006345 [Embleya sp. AB8]